MIDTPMEAVFSIGVVSVFTLGEFLIYIGRIIELLLWFRTKIILNGVVSFFVLSTQKCVIYAREMRNEEWWLRQGYLGGGRDATGFYYAPCTNDSLEYSIFKMYVI